MDCLHGDKLEAAGIVLTPLHGGCFDNDGETLLGDLQNQVVPFAHFERNVVK
jgi:hypothetical protein